VLWRHMPP